MPDLATHLGIGYLAAQTKHKASQVFVTLFLVGNLLPDLLTRPFITLFPRQFWFFTPLHTPFGSLLTCTVVCFAFEPRLRKTAFFSLALGSVFHLLLDSLQKRVVDTYGILFPFHWKDVYMGMFWPDESLYALPILLAVIVALIGSRYRNKKLEGILD